MKPTIAILLFVALVFVSYSCKETTGVIPDKTNELMPKGEAGTPVITDTLSRGKFDTMRTNWKRSSTVYTNQNTFNYFEVPIEDLKAIADEPGVTDSRFYFGMDANNIPHLMLVGLKDTVIDFGLIADYTKVCPTICPPPKIQ